MAYDSTITDPGAIQTAMKANSDAYATADTATQQQLHADNMKYAGQTGQTYDSQQGTYSAPSANVAYPAGAVAIGTATAPSSQTPFSNILKTTPTQTAPPAAPLGTQSDGSLHLNVNGQTGTDVKVFKGSSFDSARDIASQLGLSYSADPKTGEISIGGTKVSPTSYDKNGDAIVGVRNVADALGYKIGYDDKTKTITVTAPYTPKDTTIPTIPAGPTGPTVTAGPANNGYNSPMQSLVNGMPQQQQMQPWQQPDLSSFQQNMMQYQNFNPDMNQYYQQAHSQLDPQFDANNQKLMDKQTLDINNSDESMNRRGIYSSGVAQAAEDDLRSKTTNALAAGFTAQMAQIEKTATNLYNTAYKQYQDGNTFALKNNQDQVTNMLNVEKQSFSEWAQTQKLDQTQYSYALKAWDDMASKIMTDAQNQMKASQFQQTNALNQEKSLLPYQYQTMNNQANNQTSQQNNYNNNQTSLANNQNTNDTSRANALLPYQSMTVYQQATTQEKQQMDSAINYFKQQGINIDESKLMESIRHNQAGEALTANGQAITSAHNVATEKNAADTLQMNAYKLAGYLPNGQPTFDREKFNQTVAQDKNTVEIARTNATNSENKTEIDAIGKELSTISSQVNAIISSYTTDPKQQEANTAMITSLNGQRDKYLNELKQYTDQGFYTPPSN